MTICTPCYECLQLYMYILYIPSYYCINTIPYLLCIVYSYLHVSIRVTCVALCTVYLYVSLLVQSVIPWLFYVLIDAALMNCIKIAFA